MQKGHNSESDLHDALRTTVLGLDLHAIPDEQEYHVSSTIVRELRKLLTWCLLSYLQAS